MNDPTLKKLPRLYVAPDLATGQTLTLTPEQAHYLRSVLRRAPGDEVRLFNGRDGEFLATLKTVDKKTVTAACESQIAPQPPRGPDCRLLFAPIKKHRLDFLIEKAVELGATHLHPVITQNTEARQINEERIFAQITEAAEQCERFDLPQLLPLQRLEEALTGWPEELPVLACLERSNAPLLQTAGKKPCAILIGPEGGFTTEEAVWLADQPFITPVSLGPAILRSETAALAALALLAE